MTVILAAMRMEARTARALKRCNMRVAVGGIGAEQAHIAAEQLLDAGAERLLVWGVAGGLDAHLQPGDLLLPARVLNATGDTFFPDSTWRADLLHQVPHDFALDEGPLITVSRPVSGRAAKAALAKHSGAVAVDMETAAIAQAALKHQVPFAVIRAIADPLELTLPRVVTAARSERFLAAEVALRLIVRPQDLVGLKALSRAMRAARQTLTACAAQLAETHAAPGLY